MRDENLIPRRFLCSLPGKKKNCGDFGLPCDGNKQGKIKTGGARTPKWKQKTRGEIATGDVRGGTQTGLSMTAKSTEGGQDFGARRGDAELRGNSRTSENSGRVSDPVGPIFQRTKKGGRGGFLPNILGAGREKLGGGPVGGPRGGGNGCYGEPGPDKGRPRKRGTRFFPTALGFQFLWGGGDTRGGAIFGAGSEKKREARGVGCWGAVEPPSVSFGSVFVNQKEGFRGS